MDWTLALIKVKVRRLTGRPDIVQLSDADLLAFINEFYQNKLPILLRGREFETWYTLPITLAGGDTYDVDPDYLVLEKPFTLNGWEINFYENPALFYALWPETQSYTPQQPFDVLYYARKLIFRSPPDANYTFKAFSLKRPAPLSDTQNPLNPAWGPVIAYGASIDIHNDAGEIKEADALEGGFGEAFATIHREQLRQMSSLRSRPSW